MNIRQETFITEYLKTGNATLSAINSGYSERTAKSIGNRLLKTPAIKQQIDNIQEQLKNDSIADIDEVMKYWSNLLRDEEADTKDRLKASECLAKRYGLFTNKLEVEQIRPVIIYGENELED